MTISQGLIYLIVGALACALFFVGLVQDRNLFMIGAIFVLCFLQWLRGFNDKLE